MTANWTIFIKDSATGDVLFDEDTNSFPLPQTGWWIQYTDVIKRVRLLCVDSVRIIYDEKKIEVRVNVFIKE
jgi:hypothetical protein